MHDTVPPERVLQTNINNNDLTIHGIVLPKFYSCNRLYFPPYYYGTVEHEEVKKAFLGG